MKKRKLTFRQCLCLTVIFLQIIISTWLEVTLYKDVVSDVREVMSTTEQVSRNMLAARIDEGMRDIYLICAYLQQSDRLTEYIDICRDESYLMSERADAFEQIQSVMQMALSGSPVLRGIVIAAPGRIYSMQQGTADPFHLELDRPCSEEIAFFCPEKNYKNSPKAVDTKLSSLPAYSFRLKGETEIAAYLVLEDTFLDSLLDGQADTAVYTANGALIYGEAPQYRTGRALVRTDIAANEWYMVQAESGQAYRKELLVIILFGLLSFVIAILLAALLSGILTGKLAESFQRLISLIVQYQGQRKEDSTDCRNAGKKDGDFRIPKQDLFGLRDKVCMFLMVSVLVPTGLFCFLFNVGIGRVAERQTINSYCAMAENAAASITWELQKKEAVVSRIIYDSKVIELFRKEEKADLVEKLDQVIRDNIFYGLYDATLDVYLPDGGLVYSNNMIAEERMDTQKYQRESVWEYGEDALGRMRFTYTSHIRNKRYADILAYVRVSLDADRVLNQLYGLSAGRAQFFMAAPQDGGEYLTGNDVILSAPVEGTPWNIYARMEKQGFLDYQSFILRKHGVSLMILVVAVLLFSWILAFILLNPLRWVKEAMRQIEPGNPDIRLKSYFIDEIDEISRSFNEMADRIDVLVDDLLLSNNRKVQMENEKKKAEIIALQMQINPHFLSNTIETISNIVMDGGREQACGMLKSMNNLFRYGISKPEVSILVSEELQYARAYTEIMRVRYPLIRFLWDVDEEILDCMTVKLILQPIIENAIYHGIRLTGQEGCVEISGKPEGEAICFVIRDDGAGMDEKELASLREKLQDAKLGSLIGMFNVQARIRLYYGEDYGIAVESRKGVGTTVRIRVPQKREKETG